MTKNLNYGTLVISLDFEMMWGCHDWTTPQAYGASNVAHVRTVISRLLDLFSKYQVKATFATVGLLFCKDKNEALRLYPAIMPTYCDKKLSPFKDGYIEGITTENEPLYFALDIIKLLVKTQNIEVATHTFSHYFCWEQGQTLEQFEADLQKAIEVAREQNIELHSIVFPKNQVSDEYLDVCSSNGIECYRGNAQKYFEQSTTTWQMIRQRVLRILDSYLNIGGQSSIPYEALSANKRIINIPASRFLRPYSTALSFFEPLRLRRICKEMRHAAKRCELYHLWWHPHNFGANMEQNFAFLEKILQCYADCHQSLGMQSHTMHEMATLLNS